MEKITRRQDGIYYGNRRCDNANDAYLLFRRDYHDSLGKAYYRWLNRPPRQERIHDSGMYLTDEYHDELRSKYEQYGRVPCRIVGFLGICYVRMVGIWDCPDIPELEFDAYLDWLFDRKSGALRLVGRGSRAGRTSMTLNKRYR